MAGLLRDPGAALKEWREHRGAQRGAEARSRHGVSIRTHSTATKRIIPDAIDPGVHAHASQFAAVPRSVRRALRQLLMLLLVLACAAAPVEGVCGEVALKLLKQVELPGVEGRIDHMLFDRATQRLFVAALGNNSLEVVDLDKETTIASIREFERPQDLALLPEKHELLITNGDNRYLDVYDTQTLQRKRRIELKGDNDNIRHDSRTRLAYVGCGEGGESALCVVDTATYTKVKEIALSGHPESFQLEGGGKRIFVNVPTSGRIEVVDREQGRVVAEWPLDARKNFPMALDEAQGRLFVGTREPARLLVLDTKTGKSVASLASVGDVDDLFFDPETQIVLFCGGEGFVDAFQQQSADRYQSMTRAATAKGARTALYLGESKRLLVAAPKSANAPAQILIYGVTSVTSSQ
jgi:hypothetical protein